MSIFNLPDDIFVDKQDLSADLIFYNYLAPMGSFKGKSVLNKNAISLVISGEKTMHFAEKKVNIKQAEFHFLSAGNCLVTMKLSDITPFRSVLIFFDNSVLSDFYLKYDIQISAIKARLKIASEPYIAFEKDEFVLNFIASLQLLFKSPAKISNEMKHLKFEELMLHLLERYPLQLLSFQVSQSKDRDDLAIRKAVETNITNNISLEELAFLCNTSLSTFKRRFGKIYGTSPNKWMLLRRMEIAKDLLLHHHEKPSEIFYKVGYENHSSFSQSFKQTYGTTPKEFQLQQLTFQQ